jgi:serine/threonine protein phosphatase PrpC
MLVSHAEEMNPGKRNTMEDVHRAILKFGGLPGMSFLAVYDGHGGRGIADYIETRLENNILNEMRSSVPQSDENAAPTPASGGKAVEEDICPTLKAMERAYLLTDMQSRQAGIMASGATAVTCLLDRTEGVGKIYTANCGDARAVLVKKDSVVRLSHDHKAEDPVEIDRIEASGGFVLRNRVLGILAVAR